jgi:hypothetical protein
MCVPTLIIRTLYFAVSPGEVVQAVPARACTHENSCERSGPRYAKMYNRCFYCISATFGEIDFRREFILRRGISSTLCYIYIYIYILITVFRIPRDVYKNRSFLHRPLPNFEERPCDIPTYTYPLCTCARIYFSGPALAFFSKKGGAIFL